MQRRYFISGSIGLFGLGLGTGVLAQGTPIEDLKPGEFTWHPERSPSGQVAVIVSIPQQLVHVYRNGIRIAVSTCSTGKQGHATPTGVFVVLQKDRHHHSSTYNNAPMPNMNRLTWSGIALHAGQLPGYPASHGCVRLPMDFSADLFEVTHLGTPVIIAGAASDPWELTHPGLVLGGYADTEFVTIQSGLAGKKAPQDWSDAEAQPVTSLIASTADNKALLLVNEEIVAEGTLTVAGGGPLGEHVLILQGADQATSGMHWAVITHTKDDGPLAPAPDDLIRRLTVDNAFTTAMSQHLHPGMIAVLTDLPLTPDTRTGGDFVVMNSDDGTETAGA